MQYWAPPPATPTQYLSDRQYFNLHEHTTSVHLINYINLLLARCSRMFISNAVLPSIAFEPFIIRVHHTNVLY